MDAPPAAATAPARWATDPGSSRTTVLLDGLTILFHHPSRATHILDSPAPELIAALALGPCDVATLTARLAQTYLLDAEDGAALEAAVAARLAELEAAGLVRQLGARA